MELVLILIVQNWFYDVKNALLGFVCLKYSFEYFSLIYIKWLKERVSSGQQWNCKASAIISIATVNILENEFL